MAKCKETNLGSRDRVPGQMEFKVRARNRRSKDYLRAAL